MTVLSVNISEESLTRLNKSSKALGMSRSKFFEYLVSNMEVLLPKLVLPLIDEIIVLQDKLQESLSTADHAQLTENLVDSQSDSATNSKEKRR